MPRTSLCIYTSYEGSDPLHPATCLLQLVDAGETYAPAVVGNACPDEGPTQNRLQGYPGSTPGAFEPPPSWRAEPAAGLLSTEARTLEQSAPLVSAVVQFGAESFVTLNAQPEGGGRSSRRATAVLRLLRYECAWLSQSQAGSAVHASQA